MKLSNKMDTASYTYSLFAFEQNLCRSSDSKQQTLQGPGDAAIG